MNSHSGDTRQKIRQWLTVEKGFGLTELPKGQPLKKPGGEKETLAQLRETYRNCTLCTLSEKRTHVVFGAGNQNADLMFVGEAPGYEEDLQGEPFVGAAGQLLTRIIEAMKLKRSDVYIANCLKCRPPGNRNPLPSEIATCTPILWKQIEVIRPRVICALGKFAAQTLLKTEVPISRLRGRFHPMGAIQVMPTYHPAYLLRNPADKALVWQDVQQIMKLLGPSS